MVVCDEFAMEKVCFHGSVTRLLTWIIRVAKVWRANTHEWNVHWHGGFIFCQNVWFWDILSACVEYRSMQHLCDTGSSCLRLGEDHGLWFISRKSLVFFVSTVRTQDVNSGPGCHCSLCVHRPPQPPPCNFLYSKKNKHYLRASSSQQLCISPQHNWEKQSRAI